MTNPKPRIVKDYDKLPEEIINRIKVQYPEGFVDNLVSYTNKEGKKVSALPFDTEEIYYLIRMTASEARQIIEDDDDYDDDGVLRDDFESDNFSDDDDTSSDDEDFDKPEEDDGDGDDF